MTSKKKSEEEKECKNKVIVETDRSSKANNAGRLVIEPKEEDNET